MRLLLPALGVWAAEGCKELDGRGLGVLELGLMWGRAVALELPLVGSPSSPAKFPHDPGGIRKRGELSCSLTSASSRARPLELACQSPLSLILWPSYTVPLGESPVP